MYVACMFACPYGFRLHIHVCICMRAYVCVEVRGQGRVAYFWRQGLFVNSVLIDWLDCLANEL